MKTNVLLVTQQITVFSPLITSAPKSSVPTMVNVSVIYHYALLREYAPLATTCALTTHVYLVWLNNPCAIF